MSSSSSRVRRRTSNELRSASFHLRRICPPTTKELGGSWVVIPAKIKDCMEKEHTYQIWPMHTDHAFLTSDTILISRILSWKPMKDAGVTKIMAEYYDCTGRLFCLQIRVPGHLRNKVARAAGLPEIRRKPTEKQLKALNAGRRTSTVYARAVEARKRMDKSADFGQDAASEDRDECSVIPDQCERK